MKDKKISALLYSLLLWPGAGHVYLGQKKKGYFLVVLTVVILLALFVFFECELIRQIRFLSNPQQALSQTEELMMNVWNIQKINLIGCLLGLVGVWIYAVLDIYWMKFSDNSSHGPSA